MDTVRHGSDFVARYGGEEFAVLLPQTERATALAIAQRMCDSVAALQISNAGLLPARNVTISVGVASCVDEETVSSGALLRAADEALYIAKGAGRGRVECAVSAETAAG